MVSEQEPVSRCRPCILDRLEPLMGLEPTISALRKQRTTSCASTAGSLGGIRTHTPFPAGASKAPTSPVPSRGLVRLAGLEPSSPGGHTVLSRACLPFHHSRWCQGRDSNPRSPFERLLYRQVLLANSATLTGTPDRTRTDELYLEGRYVPSTSLGLVRVTGIEPATVGLKGRCST